MLGSAAAAPTCAAGLPFQRCCISLAISCKTQTEWSMPLCIGCGPAALYQPVVHAGNACGRLAVDRSKA